uniref:cGMP-dependent protein kinase n=1 Tax=Scolopendra viridis TaxID=118503 RepID=A0A4D5RA32_SCOVI
MGNGVGIPLLTGSGTDIHSEEKYIEFTAFRSSACQTPWPENDIEQVPDIVSELKAVIRQRDQRVEELETQLEALFVQLQSREEENVKLRQEIHQLKSVLQATASEARSNGKMDLLATLQEHHSMAGQGAISKRQGVSGESFSPNKTTDNIKVQFYEKDFRSKQLIKDAIMRNDFLQNLDSSQVNEIVDCMYPRTFPRGSLVIKEGEPGSHLYVSAEGELIVTKDGGILGKMGSGRAFGELAILYNCTRTASIEALTDAQVWVLDRRVFQAIMMRSGLLRQEQHINFLRSVPLFKNLSSEVLVKIADVLEIEFFPDDEYIIRQGTTGDTFYIIANGRVKVTQRIPGTDTEEEIRILERGDYFGEQALLREDSRTANVIALSPGVECLTLDRESFNQLIGDLQELQNKDYGDQVRSLQRPPSANSATSENEFSDIWLEDLDVVATLGVGGFGRVELVQHRFDKSVTFALKCLTKQHILETQQQHHIHSEKTIMMSCRSPFIARLYKTFKDVKYVYMLMEACLGGEVWTILRDKTTFDDHTTRFYTACVVEAFEYLHSHGIIYRDLKPENLLLDTKGYVKLVDFGFSKRLGNGQKTWTFCGTPEYVAPEIILNKGHDRAVDYWSLGVLMFELFTGSPPFAASDPMKTYNIILKGIDMIDFPKHISRHAQSLIKRLCRDSPSERLGYQKNGISDIKKHKWFQGFDWDGLINQTLPPPIIPEVKSPTDVSNFDCYPREFEIPPDEVSGWDADF